MTIIRLIFVTTQKSPPYLHDVHGVHLRISHLLKGSVPLSHVHLLLLFPHLMLTGEVPSQVYWVCSRGVLSLLLPAHELLISGGHVGLRLRLLPLSTLRLNHRLLLPLVAKVGELFLLLDGRAAPSQGWDVASVVRGADAPQLKQPPLLRLLGNAEELNLRGGEVVGIYAVNAQDGL